MTASILIATDNAKDAQTIEWQLTKDYKKIFVSIRSNSPVKDFDDHKPNILILAFADMAKAEAYYIDLYHNSHLIGSYPHRTILLCNKDEIEQAYQACKEDYFDDYLLFWPSPADVHQLSMATDRALLNLEASKAHAINRDINKLSFRRSNLDVKFNDYINQAKKHITTINQLQQDANYQGIPALLQTFSQLKTWLQDLSPQHEPHIESARLLKNSVKKISTTILVVDDDKLAQNLTKAALANENYTIIFASCGYEALRLLRKHHPDLILMDMNMPEFDGIEVTRRIKASALLTAIPVIMVTGNNAKADVMNSLKAGASDFIVKPISREVLLDKIAKLLHLSNVNYVAQETQEPKNTDIAEETKDTQEPQDTATAQETGEAQEPQETVATQETEEAQEPQENAAAQETGETQEPQETEEAQETKEPG
jgi:CheY-like chemotaxis protein